jgi:hypothetical protein
MLLLVKKVFGNPNAQRSMTTQIITRQESWWTCGTCGSSGREFLSNTPLQLPWSFITPWSFVTAPSWRLRGWDLHVGILPFT